MSSGKIPTIPVLLKIGCERCNSRETVLHDVGFPNSHSMSSLHSLEKKKRGTPSPKDGPSSSLCRLCGNASLFWRVWGEEWLCHNLKECVLSQWLSQLHSSLDLPRWGRKSEISCTFCNSVRIFHNYARRMQHGISECTAIKQEWLLWKIIIKNNNKCNCIYK